MAAVPKRTAYLNLRVRKSELHRWKASARSSEQTLSDWLRTAADERAKVLKAARDAEIPNRVVTGEQRDLPLPPAGKKRFAAPTAAKKRGRSTKAERATAS